MITVWRWWWKEVSTFLFLYGLLWNGHKGIIFQLNINNYSLKVFPKAFPDFTPPDRISYFIKPNKIFSEIMYYICIHLRIINDT